MCGFHFGNGRHPGCLTINSGTRLHTCEFGVECELRDAPRTVWISPVIARTSEGYAVQEIGAVSGRGDLNVPHEIELRNTDMVKFFMELCSLRIKDKQTCEAVKDLILIASKSARGSLSIPSANIPQDFDEFGLGQLVDLLQDIVKSTALCRPLPNAQKPSGHVLNHPKRREEIVCTHDGNSRSS